MLIKKNLISYLEINKKIYKLNLINLYLNLMNPNKIQNKKNLKILKSTHLIYKSMMKFKSK